jgi:hypothetical protein
MLQTSHIITYALAAVYAIIGDCRRRASTIGFASHLV